MCNITKLGEWRSKIVFVGRVSIFSLSGMVDTELYPWVSIPRDITRLVLVKYTDACVTFPIIPRYIVVPHI